MNDMPSPYYIQSATAEDALELAHMHNQSWYDTYPNESLSITRDYLEGIVERRLSDKGLDFRRNLIQRAKAEDTYFLRIAKNESGAIVGFIDGFLHDDRYELAGLYTNKNTHGTGLGSQLWESYVQWVDPSKPIWLTVVTYNERVKAFYRKLGFIELPETNRIYSDTIIPVVDMEKLPAKV